MVSYEEIEAAALDLPRAERERLAVSLIRSLDDDLLDIDRDVVVAAWMDEIDERWRQYLAGEMDAVSATEVIADARKRLSRSPGPPS